jgi:hypothetical protein
MSGAEWYEFKTMREAQAEIERLRALADDLAAALSLWENEPEAQPVLARYREARQR